MPCTLAMEAVGAQQNPAAVDQHMEKQHLHVISMAIAHVAASVRDHHYPSRRTAFGHDAPAAPLPVHHGSRQDRHLSQKRITRCSAKYVSGSARAAGRSMDSAV